jgi:hypothetical protein
MNLKYNLNNLKKVQVLHSWFCKKITYLMEDVEGYK